MGVQASQISNLCTVYHRDTEAHSCKVRLKYHRTFPNGRVVEVVRALGAISGKHTITINGEEIKAKKIPVGRSKVIKDSGKRLVKHTSMAVHSENVDHKIIATADKKLFRGSISRTVVKEAPVKAKPAGPNLASSVAVLTKQVMDLVAKVVALTKRLEAETASKLAIQAELAKTRQQLEELKAALKEALASPQ